MSSGVNLDQVQRGNRLGSKITEGRSNSTIETIQKAVAKYYGLTIQTLKTTARTRTIVLPRQISIYLIRKLTGISFREIGVHFGGKDHTTILHACRKIEKLINTDKMTYEVVASIRKRAIGPRFCTVT